MARSQNSSSSVPTALVKERREGWNAFTRATVIGCVSLAALLLLMLLFLR